MSKYNAKPPQCFEGNPTAKKTYRVKVEVRDITIMEVEANSLDDAMDLVDAGEGEVVDFREGDHEAVDAWEV